MTAEELKQLLEEVKKTQEEQLAALKASQETQMAANKEFVLGEMQKRIDEFNITIANLNKAIEIKQLPIEERGPEEGVLPHKFKSLAHFAHDIVTAGRDNRGASVELIDWQKTVDEYFTKATQTAGDAELGGTLIPTEYSNIVLERTFALSTILQNALVIPMVTNKIDIPMLEGFDQSQGKVDGNVVWYWTGEEKQYAGSDFKTAAVGLVLHKCTGMAVVTNELLKWSRTSIEPLVQRAFERGLNMALNRAFIEGTGAGQPQGVLNSPATVSVPKATNQDPDTFILDNVLDMIARLYSPNETIGEGFWYMNKTVLPQLGKLSVAVGTGGNGLFMVNNSIQGRPDFSLMGIPIRFSQFMKVVGDVGDVGLFDWSQYIVGQPVGAGVESSQSIHLYFDYDKTAFKFTFYIDGRVWWPDNYKPLHGDSQSSFVTLAARA